MAGDIFTITLSAEGLSADHNGRKKSSGVEKPYSPLPQPETRVTGKINSLMDAEYQRLHLTTTGVARGPLG